MGPLLKKNHLLRCWNCLSLLNWIGALTLSLLQKLFPSILEPLFVLLNFFLLRLLCVFVNQIYDLAWNTVVTSGLVFPTNTGICCINCSNGYVRHCHSFFASFEHLAVRQNVASLFFIGATLADIHLNIFSICFPSFSSPFSCNSIPCRDCLALLGVSNN